MLLGRCSFLNPENKPCVEDDVRQMWRNHLLGLSMKKKDGIDDFYSITLLPDGNKHFHEHLSEYCALLQVDE